MASVLEQGYAGRVPVAELTVEDRLSFLRRTYGWMTAALGVTAIGAAITIQSGLVRNLMNIGLIGNLLLVAAWMGIGYIAQKVRHKPVVNAIAYAAYALFTGFVISGLVVVAMIVAEMNGAPTGTYIYQALGLTVLSFAGLTAYAYFTKRDFSFMGGMLTVALVTLIGLSIMSFFIESTFLHLAISALGILVFSGYILFDTQKILKTYPANEHVAASLTLFLDFVLLFMHILRLIVLLAADDYR